jgi:hypothetical protein
MRIGFIWPCMRPNGSLVSTVMGVQLYNMWDIFLLVHWLIFLSQYMTSWSERANNPQLTYVQWLSEDYSLHLISGSTDTTVTTTYSTQVLKETGLSKFMYYNCGIYNNYKPRQADPSGRAVQGVGLQPLACWDCWFESRRKHECLSVVSVVCWEAEVSATDWYLIQKSPTASVCVWLGKTITLYGYSG